MTRPIKFRVIDIEEKRWIPIEDFDDPLSIITGGNDRYRRFIASQFTGLLDKNGKEIYEGDRIRCYDKSGEKVYDHPVELPNFYREIWSNKTWTDEQGYHSYPAENGEKCNEVEVIGNIYENPELLTS